MYLISMGYSLHLPLISHVPKQLITRLIQPTQQGARLISCVMREVFPVRGLLVCIAFKE